MIFERSKKYPNRKPTSIEAGVSINPKRLFSIETNFIDFPELPAPGSPPLDHIRVYAVADADFTVLETVTDLGIVNRINQDNFRVARNTSGAPIAKGKAIRFTGSIGNKPNFSLANAALQTTMPCIGITTAIVADSAFGEVMILGRVTGMKTDYTTPSVQAPSANWTEGDQIYVSTTDGELTNGRPVHPNLAQWVGTIEKVHATTGILLIKVQAFLGIEDGTNRNSFTIGDTGAGDKSLIFNGTNDSIFKWDSTNSKFYLTTGNLYLSAGTVSCSTLTDGYIPKHTSDAVGLADSLLIENASGVGSGVTPAVRLHIGGTVATDIIRADIGLDFNPVLKPNPAPVVALIAEAGLVDIGKHYYYVSYYTALGETALMVTNPTNLTTDAGHGKVRITLPVSTDYRVVGRRIYRTPITSGSTYWVDVKRVISIANNVDVSYDDNIADAALTGTNYYYQDDSTGKYLTVNGSSALFISLKNSVIGSGAGATILAGTAQSSFNSILGVNAADALTTGAENVAIGHGALSGATSSGDNVAVGYIALRDITTGGFNTAIGAWAGSRNVTGNTNVYIGFEAGYGGVAQSHSGNVFIGYDAAFNITTGGSNVFLGKQSGYTNTSGESSVFLGFQAGYYETVGSKLFIDNAKRTNEATARVQALIYGIFAATTAAQYVTLNAHLNVLESIDITTVGTTTANALTFGADTNLYRLAANSLKTDDALTVVGAFGCNTKAAQTGYPCAAWDEPGAGAFGVDSAAHMAALVELVKDIQAALIANGIMAAI